MNYVYIATSLDGYIAKKDGDIEWLNEQPNPDNDDYGYSTFMAGLESPSGKQIQETSMKMAKTPTTAWVLR